MALFNFKVMASAALAFLCLASTQSFAEDCDTLPTQGEMNACEGRNFKHEDASLNSVYQKLIAKITPDGRDKLRDAETSWVKYRDAQCAFNSKGSEGGSIHSSVMAQCLSALTRAQTEQLRSQLTCEEGDTSCGNQ